MSGTLQKRKKSWLLGYMYEGKRYYKSIPFEQAKTEKQARRFLEEFCIDIRKSNFSDITNYSFAGVTDLWLKQVVSPNYSPLCLNCYIKNLNNHILPVFASRKIASINSLEINEFIKDLKLKETNYANRENHKLSNGTIEKIYHIFHTIIQYAYDNDIIAKNPCDKIKLNLKKQEDGTIHYYTIEQYNHLLEELKKEDITKRLVIEMAIKTGLRRSELFGLQWQDINFGTSILSVNKTRQKVQNKMYEMATKTYSSKRDISIPASLTELLKEYHKTHNGEYILQDIDYDNVTAWFRYWQEKHGLPRIKFHDLRHTHATILLSQGVDIKTIQKRLGHSDISTTLNVYAHSVQELDKKASQVFDNL